jgi:hypothetical protein
MRVRIRDEIVILLIAVDHLEGGLSERNLLSTDIRDLELIILIKPFGQEFFPLFIESIEVNAVIDSTEMSIADSLNNNLDIVAVYHSRIESKHALTVLSSHRPRDVFGKETSPISVGSRVAHLNCNLSE